jgi:hypothetical protein
MSEANIPCLSQIGSSLWFVLKYHFVNVLDVEYIEGIQWQVLAHLNFRNWIKELQRFNLEHFLLAIQIFLG